MNHESALNMSDESEYRYGLIYCTVCGNRAGVRVHYPPERKGEVLPEIVLGMTEDQAAEVRRGRCVYCGGAMDVKWRDDIEPPDDVDDE